MAASGILSRVALVRTDVSEELSASIIRVPLKRRFLQEPHGVTSQKMPFFIVTTVKTSNLTYNHLDCGILYHATSHYGSWLSVFQMNMLLPSFTPRQWGEHTSLKCLYPDIRLYCITSLPLWASKTLVLSSFSFLVIWNAFYLRKLNARSINCAYREVLTISKWQTILNMLNYWYIQNIIFKFS
jgi:hypothetical protein